jgi:hypothetical protein
MRAHDHGKGGDERKESRSTAAARSRGLSVAPSGATLSARDVLALQATAGNLAVSRMLSPAPGHSGTPAVQRMPKVTKPKSTKRTGPLDPKTAEGATLKEKLIAELVNGHGWKRFGAGQSLTLHRPTADAEGHGGIPGAKGGIYNETANVRGPKSFEGKRSQQAMRWICNLAMHELNKLGARPEEVQATITGGVMYISSNNNAANANLSKLIGGSKTGKAFAKNLVHEQELGARLDRHRRKLKHNVADGSTEGAPAPDNYLEIMNVEIKVPEDVDKKEDGLHAERRLKKQVPELDAAKTIGVKRPCTVCYREVYAELVKDGNINVYPGPLWTSAAANKNVPQYETKSVAAYAKALTEAVDAAGGTYITLSQDDQVTWDYNTDSDTSGPDSSPDERSGSESP